MRLGVFWPAIFALLISLILAVSPSLGQVPGTVTTDCEPCQAVAQALNDTIAQARFVGQQMQDAEKALGDVDAEIAAQEAAKAAAEAEGSRLVTERERARASGDTAAAEAADVAQQAAFDRAIDILNDIEFRLQNLRDAAQARMDRLVDDLVVLLRRMKEQYAELAECEKQCNAAGGDQPGVALPEPEAEPEAVLQPATTDCPACEGIVSQINDTRGSIIATARELGTAEEVLAEAERAADEARANIESATQELEDLVLEGEALRASANPDAGAIAANDAAKTAATKKLNEALDAPAGTPLELRARVRALADRLAELRAMEADLLKQLAECEKQCAAAEAGEQSSTGVPEPEAGPAPADPDGFVTTDCALCRQIATDLNDVLRALIARRAEVESLNAAIPELEDAIKDADWDWKVADGDFRLQLALETDFAREGREEERQAAAAKQTAASEAMEAAEATIKRLTAEIEAARQRLEALAGEIGQLTQREAELRAELAECEKMCAELEEAIERSSTGPLGPEDDPNLQPVTTDCPACEGIVSRLNDTRGAIIVATRELLTAEDELLEAYRADDAAKANVDDAIRELEDLVLEGEALRASANPDAGAIAANDAAKTAASEKLGEAETARSKVPLAERLARVNAIAERLVELRAIEADLVTQLAECEKQCKAAEEGKDQLEVPGTTPEVGPVSDFVTTDCPACEGIVSLLNDVIGSLKNLPEQISEAQAELDEVTAKEAEIDARRADAQARFESSLQTGENLRRDNPGATAEIAAADAAKDTASAEVRSIEAELNIYRLLHVYPAQEKLEALQKSFEEYKKLEAELRAQLAECEKQCKAAEEAKDQLEVPGTTPEVGPVSDFVTTDCPACEGIVSLLNDVIGSLKTLPGQISEAQAELDEAKAGEAELDARRADAQARFESSLQTGENLRRDNPGATAEIAAADAAKDTASAEVRSIEAELNIYRLLHVYPAQEKLEALQKSLEEYKKLEAELRAQLAECEKRCAAEGDQPGVALPEEGEAPAPDSGIITTDCPACEDLAAALNETAQRRRAASEALVEALSAYDVIRRNLNRAQDDADAAFAEGGRAAAAAAQAREAGDQAAVDEAVAKQEEAFTREANQRDAADDLSLQLDAAQAAVETAQAAFDALNALFEQQAAELLECEKSCVEESTETGLLTTPKFGIELVQREDECEEGETCTLVVTLTSELDTYTGPVFLSADVRPLGGAGMLGDWFCGLSPKQSSLCYANADELVEGGTLTLIMPFSPTDGGVCFAVSMPDFGEPTTISAAIQLGLTSKGFELGTIDGMIGPKSLSAVDSYLAEDASAGRIDDAELILMLRSQDPDEVLEAQAELFNRFFGRQPIDLEDYDEMLDCLDLRLKTPLMFNPAPDDGDDGVSVPDDDDDEPVRTPRIGIEFDFDREEERRDEEENEEGGGFGFPGFNPLGGGDRGGGGGGGITFGF